MTSLTHEFTDSLDAAPERVFAALTDEAQLTGWFAEQAEIDLREGGNFRFWGRHTYGTPARWQSRQKVVRVQAPSLIVFSWPMDGVESEVTLELAADPDAAAGERTVLKGRHHFPEGLPVERAEDLVDDMWRIARANLRAHLAGGAGVYLPDYSDPVPRVRQAVTITAPRWRVFHALIDPPTLNRWIASNAAVEPEMDGRYTYGWKYEVKGRQVEGGPTKILEIVENAKLVTDWPDWRGDLSRPVQRVSWVLEAINDQTRVTLIHEPFERTSDLSDYPHGWADFLSKLKKQVESTST
jgi:uncharacterized protein YndB with AHSA1/START domain